MFDPSKLSYKTVKAAVQVINNPDYRRFMEEAVDEAYQNHNFAMLKHGLGVHTWPVHIEEFMFGAKFLSRPKDELYSPVVEELVNINEGHGRLMNRLTEGVFTGGIGSAKTTTALYTNAYQLYLLSCYKNPHVTFQMDSTSEILFIFQSMNATLSKEVDYERFRAICEQSYYFTVTFPYDKSLKGSLKFPHRIEAKPIGSDGGAIGQNVLGGLIDEVNFMAVIEESKKSSSRGVYDQAKAIYDGVSRRIKTRFVANGGMPGILCLVSSKNYPGEFTDIKLREAANDPTIYIYDKRVWDIKPPGTYSGVRFPIFVGDETRKARILTTTEDLSEEDKELVMMVPEEYRKSFENDMIGSLRDIAGVSTMARYPYIQNLDAISAMTKKGRSILSKEEHDFLDSTPLQVFLDRLKYKDEPRWVHVDLAISGDAAGVTCGCVPGFVPAMGEEGKVIKTNGDEIEMLPRIHLDFMLRVLPPKGGEIKFYKIRELLTKLRDLGVPIKWVSFDSFQSVDSVQLLRQSGFATGYISVDTSPVPYAMTKEAIYDGRLIGHPHHVAQREFSALERIVKKNKIDHPPNGSKDVTDSVAGVVFGLSTRKEVWIRHNVTFARAPQTFQQAQLTVAKQGPKHEALDSAA